MQDQYLIKWNSLNDEGLIEQCRNSFREEGVAILQDVVSESGLLCLQKEVSAAPFNDSTQYYTAWQDEGDLKYLPSHPRNYKTNASAAFAGKKSLEQSSPTSLSIFRDDRLVTFLSRVADRQLYRSKDENGSIYVYKISQKHQPPWHFDESPYTAIIYLQKSEEGGAFQFVPWSRPSRSKDDAAGHQIVKEVSINGDTSRVRSLNVDPGTLIFFSGAHSFHRACPVGGSRDRVGLVFTFSDSEGFSNSDYVKHANEWDPEDIGKK